MRDRRSGHADRGAVTGRVARQRDTQMDDRIAAATLTCPPGMWSEPRVVSELPPGTFLRTPSFTVGPETFLLTGVPSPASAQAATIILPGNPILKSETGETIRRPPGDFELINARLLTGPDGLQHLIWGDTLELNRTLGGNCVSSQQFTVDTQHTAIDPVTSEYEWQTSGDTGTCP